MLPEFATHYHLAERPPFLNLSDVGDSRIDDVIRELQQLRRVGRNHRRFGRTYLLWRRATEEKLYRLFIERGGKPERRAPHYFVLGSCRWFERLAKETRSVCIPLSELPDEVTSFTYPDSFGAMALGPEFGQGYDPRPYHEKVFRMSELPTVVQEFGLPDDSPADDYSDYHLKDGEKYIEIQLWSDDPIQRYLSPHKTDG